MVEIRLTKGLVALIDDEDLGLISESTWHASKHGKSYYASGMVDTKKGRKNKFMHRVIMGVHEGCSNVVIDHRDGNPLNNQKSNLRLCTQKENNKNKSAHRNSSSKYVGVSYDKSRSKWRATIMDSGKLFNIGRFDCEIEAAMAYDAKAKELHGEFANLNFKTK